MRFESLTVRRRLALMLLAALAGLVLITAITLAENRDVMRAGYARNVKSQVELAAGVVQHFHALEQSGALDRSSAQQAAKEALRGLRYQGSEYFFVNGLDLSMLLHPISPALEGKVTDLKDSTGKHFVREMVALAREKGGGYVDYLWPRSGVASDPAQPKISYVKMVPDWNWVVGTGVYVDDIDTAFRNAALHVGGLVAVAVVVLVMIGLWVIRGITRALGGEPAYAGAIMKRAADGDLAVEVERRGPADSLLGNLSTMMAQLRTMMGEIGRGAAQLSANSHGILEVSRAVSKASENQTGATAAIAAAIEEMTVSIGQITENAMGAERNSEHSAKLAGRGAAQAEHAGSEMQAISGTVDEARERIELLVKRADEVGAIAGVIKEIAAQTNLLALNAAIEAARAGEQGRGFAVVADEVRKLAERTSTATVQIEQDIAGIQAETQGTVDVMSRVSEQVGGGITLVLDVAASLREIAGGTAEALEQIHSVAEATAEQRAAATSVAQEVEQIAQMVEGTNASMHSAVTAVEQLEQLSLDLNQMVARFKV